MNMVWTGATSGGALSEALLFGQLIGPCNDGVLAVDLTDTGGTLIFPCPVVKLVGGTKNATSGLPDSFITGVPEEDEIGPFITYAGSCSQGLTVLCAAIHNSGPVDSDIVHLYRSIDGGASFTDVHEWPFGLAGKHGAIQIAYSGMDGGIWWVSPGEENGIYGLWRSTDNGQGWELVPLPEEIGLHTDVEWLTSAGRATPSMS